MSRPKSRVPRNKHLHLRVTDNELETLKARCKDACMTYSAYFSTFISTPQTFYLAPEHDSDMPTPRLIIYSKNEMNNWIAQIKKIGTNLNQGIKALNTLAEKAERLDRSDFLAFEKTIRADLDTYKKQINELEIMIEMARENPFIKSR